MSVLDDLAGLSAAEEFFAYLDVAYEPAVVHVARLHLLRRMGHYLKISEAEGAFDALDEEAVRLLCRTHLQQAYQDFVASSPIEERLFKVHQDAASPKPQPAKPFVALSSVTGANSGT
ncbi:nitrogenase stabilizing/protective protein NifW [Breoghania sp.]|uniref:nitrogenase stabilizing/protective protein NifW n=1 Tax=Breoghania sp. TaxID=2065378 RepID=UPI00261CF52E|nr:nitrogenase stabilizing/protective protein NifW [Breoghania sp.]MDJ0933237.1 nitrogenase stabilizing/protective protein NifW [Breoghania sp.]